MLLMPCPEAHRLTQKEESDTHSEVECYVASVVQGIPASPSRMESIKMATAADNELQSVLKFVRSGWHTGNAPLNIRAYMKVKNELSEADGLLICGSKIVIPLSPRADILKKIHIKYTSSVWWPRLC